MSVVRRSSTRILWYFNMRVKNTLLLSMYLSIMTQWFSKLIMVYQIGRHGFRSGGTYFQGLTEDPEDNFISSKYELTEQGMKQMYDINKFKLKINAHWLYVHNNQITTLKFVEFWKTTLKLKCSIHFQKFSLYFVKD